MHALITTDRHRLHQVFTPKSTRTVRELTSRVPSELEETTTLQGTSTSSSSLQVHVLTVLLPSHSFVLVG